MMSHAVARKWKDPLIWGWKAGATILSQAKDHPWWSITRNGETWRVHCRVFCLVPSATEPCQILIGKSYLPAHSDEATIPFNTLVCSKLSPLWLSFQQACEVENMSWVYLVNCLLAELSYIVLLFGRTGFNLNQTERLPVKMLERLKLGKRSGANVVSMAPTTSASRFKGVSAGHRSHSKDCCSLWKVSA